METYFNYEQALTSKKLVEAISIPHGIGPFCGFNGWSLTADGKSIELSTSTMNQPSYRSSLGRESFWRKYSHRVFRDGLGININFGCISRDGYIYVDDATTKTILIEGTKGSNSDIIVVAIHTPMSEPIENPITFRAFWSQASESIYTTYYEDLNPTSIQSDGTLSNLYSLEKWVDSSLGNNTWDSNTMCIIGIYGQGNNPDTKATESFAIVPYDGQLTYNISLTQGTLNYIEKTLKALTTLTDGVPEGYTNIVEYLQKYHELNSKKETPVTNNALPKGTIVMWYGEQSTIPTGWELCDGGRAVNDPSMTKPNLMGRVPLGLSTTDQNYKTSGTIGGSDSITLKIDQVPRHRHRIAFGQAKWGDNANNRNFPMFGGNDGDSDYQNDEKWRGKNYTDYTGGNSDKEGSASPIDIRQSYCVVAFIIKTVD